MPHYTVAKKNWGSINLIKFFTASGFSVLVQNWWFPNMTTHWGAVVGWRVL